MELTGFFVLNVKQLFEYSRDWGKAASQKGKEQMVCFLNYAPVCNTPGYITAPTSIGYKKLYL